jgi:hypothetical protein
VRDAAWRGDERNASIPKRAMSYRLETIDIISIAQQARPKVSGHIDFVWAQFTAFSSVVSPRYCSSSSAVIDCSNFDGPLLGQSRRSDWRPWSRSRSTN